MSEPPRDERTAAEAYERRWAGYLATTTRRTLAGLQLPSGGRLLDVGCGTGLLLRDAASRFPGAELIGVDRSSGMLRVAEARGTPATLLCADAARLPLADASCDAVVTASSLHFWSDPDEGVREIARVARTGAAIVVTDWCRDFFTTRMIVAWLRLTGRAGFPRVLGTRDAAALLARTGIRVSGTVRYRAGLTWGLMTLTGTCEAPRRTAS